MLSTFPAERGGRFFDRMEGKTHENNQRPGSDPGDF